MNQSSRTIYNSSLAHLFYEHNFQLKFSLFGSWIKIDELIVELSSELLSSWFDSLPALPSHIRGTPFLKIIPLPSPRNLWSIERTPKKLLWNYFVLDYFFICSTVHKFKFISAIL